MQWHRVHGCAAWLVGKSDLADADLAYVRTHDKDAEGARLGLALCMHHDDEAATTFIEQLGDPNKRGATLLMLSSFESLPASYPHDVYREGIARVSARAEVQAAIARAGGAGHFDIPPL